MNHGHELALSFPPMHPSKPETSPVRITWIEVLSFSSMHSSKPKQNQLVSQGVKYIDLLHFTPMQPSKPYTNLISITRSELSSFLSSTQASLE